jgi:hypothetical protein
MTKQEIKAEMERLLIFKTNGSRHDLWNKAFEMYNAGKSQKLRQGCGSCYQKVREWLVS